MCEKQGPGQGLYGPVVVVGADDAAPVDEEAAPADDEAVVASRVSAFDSNSSSVARVDFLASVFLLIFFSSLSDSGYMSRP